MISPNLFQTLLLDWFHQHGRKTLPWQHPQTPYRVWISEVMLQQTQVKTVIPYFERFIRRFPTIEQLADAEQDVVLSLWGGLGYYTRARHLHQAAKKIVRDFAGGFPNEIDSLQTLPGIGRSTAGAILALGFNQHVPILDGNVKRVLSRLHAIEGTLNASKTIQQLWRLAEQYTSSLYPRDYTQAIMDFGAMMCTRSSPHCTSCPISAYCLAYQQNKTDAYPQKKHKKTLPKKDTNWLILVDHDDQILLEKRPPIGIWGGLWSLPECGTSTDVINWCKTTYHCEIISTTAYAPIRHSFSHFHLVISPLVCRVRRLPSINDNLSYSWIQQKQLEHKGLAAPVKKLVEQLFKSPQLLSPITD